MHVILQASMSYLPVSLFLPQTKISREAVQAHKNILENVLSKVINLKEVLERQLLKTMEEQDKIESLLRRLPANGIGGEQQLVRAAESARVGVEPRPSRRPGLPMP